MTINMATAFLMSKPNSRPLFGLTTGTSNFRSIDAIVWTQIIRFLTDLSLSQCDFLSYLVLLKKNRFLLLRSRTLFLLWAG